MGTTTTHTGAYGPFTVTDAPHYGGPAISFLAVSPHGRELARALFWPGDREALIFDQAACTKGRRCKPPVRPIGADADSVRALVAQAASVANPWPALDFNYHPWRHGGWYTNVRYPSGACGCVSRNYDDGKWRIACNPMFEEAPTFRNRDEAARAEGLAVAIGAFCQNSESFIPRREVQAARVSA